MQILANVSQGFKTLIFTLEMPKWKMAQRYLKKNLNDKVQGNLELAEKKFTLKQVETLIRTKAKQGTTFFVIDSLMKLKTENANQKTNEKYSEISHTLARLAIENDIIIFLIAQMSKEDIKSKHLSLKNSGDIEYDADIILYLLKKQTRDPSQQYKRILVCDKNRQTGNEFLLNLEIDPNTIELVAERPEVVIEYQG